MEGEKTALKEQLLTDSNSPEVCFVEQAMEMLLEREALVKVSQTAICSRIEQNMKQNILQHCCYYCISGSERTQASCHPFRHGGTET